MKIALNWLKKYVKIPISDEELVRLIGARLVEVERVEDETHKYDKIYVAEVKECERIPDTHLSLCKIDVGEGEIAKVEKEEDGLIQVVCGASNVRAGMLAAWIAPGAIVPASVHEDAPFKIGKRKMLGKYDSNGMLAGADELDFGDDHSGIVEIDPKMAKAGDLLADVFELNDLILEIENKSLTHRPDTFGMIGFAREVAGILGEKFENPEKVLEDVASSTLTVKIADAAICPRYSALVLEKHGEMKKKYLTWMDTVLSKSGMRPCDPIVDATNYWMLLTGQPLHAFDYDKFVAIGGKEKPEVKVRLAKEGERLLLLDGREIELTANDIVICSGDKPVALAGAMGGDSTKIDENTRKIILESATFSLYNLRKTQMSHGIFSEAITRFTKGQPAYQTLAVARGCAELLATGFRVTEMADVYPMPEKESVVKITTDEINKLLGTEYDDKTIIRTLENVEFKIEKQGGELKITAPAWRTDIKIKEDIIEEVGRLKGYDNILLTLPLHGTAEKNYSWDLKRKVREVLTKYGANEVLTYSFVSGRLLEKAGQKAENSYRIVNSISPDLQYIRQSIVPSLLEKAYMNEKLPVEKFAMYEINQVYQKNGEMDADGVPVGQMKLGFVIAERKGTDTAFYVAKKYVAKLLAELNIVAEFKPMQENNTAEAMPFEKKRTAEILVNGERLGVVGEMRNLVRNEFKLAPYVAGFEIDFAKVMTLATDKKQIELKKTIKEDVTVKTEKSYAATLSEIEKQYPGAMICPGVIYRAPGATELNMTFHIEK